MATTVTTTITATNNTETEDKNSAQDAPSQKQFKDVRVAIVGNVDSGKSTLIGVLTSGGLDDGRGKARSKVFVHRHELATGRTSCISQHIMGFDTEQKAVHQPIAASATAAQKNKCWRDVVEKSSSILTLIDLAGHEKYLKTTIAGLTGCAPDFAVVVIGSNMGITKMTKEHLGVVIALDIPVICVITKIDMCPENVLVETKKTLFRILKSPGARKVPFEVRSDGDIKTVLADNTFKICPVFLLSSVTGTGLSLLMNYLSQLQPRQTPEILAAAQAVACGDENKAEPVEFNVDETFVVTGVGLVVSGTISRGILIENSTLLLGPFSDGSFRSVVVKTIQCKRTPVERCVAGSSCAISIRSAKQRIPLKRSDIRRGMVLVDPSAQPRAAWSFDAEVLVLHHPTTIKSNYQAVIHCGMIRQTAAIKQMTAECMRTGDRCAVQFHFLMRPEYLHENQTFIFREGSTKGMGRVTKVHREAETKEHEEKE